MALLVFSLRVARWGEEGRRPSSWGCAADVSKRDGDTVVVVVWAVDTGASCHVEATTREAGGEGADPTGAAVSKSDAEVGSGVYASASRDAPSCRTAGAIA